ncbi:hypothetical protein GGS26DRAFT_506035 [Hypomontagnella submonticulosa]|nr:hypothetical protein GGS26DRAFT_506035 [Hypomontagnella submonticulosa]
MPQDSPSTDETQSTKGTDESTKTRRGSPVPQPPDVPGPAGDSPVTPIDHDVDRDTFGFGSQFD